MSVYGKRINSSFPLFPCFPSGKDNLRFLRVAGAVRGTASHLCNSCLDGIVSVADRKQPLMISDRARLPSFPPSKETVCLITPRIERVKAS